MNFKEKLLYLRSFPKTLYFNFKYFKFKDAIKLPVFVSNKVWLKLTKGKIIINSDKIHPALIKIGAGDVGIFDRRRSRTIWEVSGTIVFNGKCKIGHGAKISVAKEGTLELGDNFSLAAETAIVCHKNISFGHDCLISWENLIMDTDIHTIKDMNGNRLNENQPIQIGNNVWIGCRNLILKGSKIPSNCVIAANSLISKSFSEENQIIGGNPCEVLKKNIMWEG